MTNENPKEKIKAKYFTGRLTLLQFMISLAILGIVLTVLVKHFI